MNDCLFCNIINKDIPSKPVFENDEIIVINDIHPQAPIHLLIIPKVHTLDIEEMEEQAFVSYMKQVRTVIKNQHIKKFRIVHNGKGAQFIPHTHVHVMGSIDPTRNL